MISKIKGMIKPLTFIFAVLAASFVFIVALDTQDSIWLSFLYGFTAFIFVSFLLTMVVWFYKSSIKTEEIDDFKTESGNEIVALIIKKLRQRSKKLLFAARLTLVLIFMVLIGGSVVFVSAESIALSNSLEAREFAGEVSYKVKIDARRAIEEAALEYDHVISKEDNNLSKPVVVSGFLKQIESRVSENTIANISNQLDLALTKLENQSNRGSSATVISALSTRIGSVFLLLFLVQILVSLYRYSTRLAAFYDGRADALQLCKDLSDVNLEMLVNLASPDDLDFAKSQKAPTDQAIELTKQLVGRSTK